MRKFLKTYGAEKWYMKAWSSKEIAAVACVLSLMPFFGNYPY
jgi:hypothetical protein